jgi:predicted nucleotidyltransferase
MTPPFGGAAPRVFAWFGSRARGTERPDSDLDLFIDYDPARIEDFENDPIVRRAAAHAIRTLFEAKLDMSPALLLFGAGREKRIYAVPPYTRVESLDFDDHPFVIERWSERCALCGSDASFLDEIVVDDEGHRMFVCSDTDYCRERREPPDRSVA